MRAFDGNPRRITKQALMQLRKNLDELGDLSGVVENVADERIAPLSHGQVVGGHQRLKAMFGSRDGEFAIDDANIEIVKTYDKPTAQGTVAEGYIVWHDYRYAFRRVVWDDETFRRANFAANKQAGEWDWDMFTGMITANDLEKWGYDVNDWSNVLNQDAKNLRKLAWDLFVTESNPIDRNVDEIDNLVSKWHVENNQIWQLGVHRLMCADSTVKHNVESLMNGKRSTLLFTDPPYGVAISDKNRELSTLGKSSGNFDNIYGDAGVTQSGVDLDEMITQSLRLAHDVVCADDCAIFVCSPTGDRLFNMVMVMRNAGFTVHHSIVWIKDISTFSVGRLDYDYQHEIILFTWMRSHKMRKRGIFRTTVWSVDKPRANKYHPTIKPIELYINALLNHTDEGDILYDPFCGSGTAIIAAENTGRVCYAMEIEPKYVAVALQRYYDAFGVEPEIVRVSGEGRNEKNNLDE